MRSRALLPRCPRTARCRRHRHTARSCPRRSVGRRSPSPQQRAHLRHGLPGRLLDAPESLAFCGVVPAEAVADGLSLDGDHTMLWDTMSWSSRAMRARSSATARCSRSAYLCRSSSAPAVRSWMLTSRRRRTKAHGKGAAVDEGGEDVVAEHAVGQGVERPGDTGQERRSPPAKRRVQVAAHGERGEDGGENIADEPAARVHPDRSTRRRRSRPPGRRWAIGDAMPAARSTRA